METLSTIDLEYTYETLRERPHSVLERFATKAEWVVSAAPVVVPGMEFGTAGHIAGGILDSAVRADADWNYLRSREVTVLRRIRYAGATLLEHHRDRTGRLTDTVYADGSRSAYSWDPEGRLAVVRSDDSQLCCGYDADGRLTSLEYPLKQRFAYRYDAGRLAGAVLPDGAGIDWASRDSGRTVETRIGASTYDFRLNETGATERLTYQGAAGRESLDLRTKSIHVEFASGKTHSGEIVASSAIGEWKVSPEGRLTGMALADGEVFSLTAGGADAPASVWDTTGLTSYRFAGGVVSSVVNPDGAKSLYRCVVGTRDCLLVTPVAAVLCRYDKRGRLERVISPDGSYCILKLDAKGRPRAVRTAEGSLAVGYDGEDRVVAVRLSSGVGARIRYADGVCPRSISFRGLRVDPLQGVLAISRAVWRWVALRSFLRLEDVVR